MSPIAIPARYPAAVPTTSMIAALAARMPTERMASVTANARLAPIPNELRAGQLDGDRGRGDDAGREHGGPDQAGYAKTTCRHRDHDPEHRGHRERQRPETRQRVDERALLVRSALQQEDRGHRQPAIGDEGDDRRQGECDTADAEFGRAEQARRQDARQECGADTNDADDGQSKDIPAEAPSTGRPGRLHLVLGQVVGESFGDPLRRATIPVQAMTSSAHRGMDSVIGEDRAGRGVDPVLVGPDEHDRTGFKALGTFGPIARHDHRDPERRTLLLDAPESLTATRAVGAARRRSCTGSARGSSLVDDPTAPRRPVLVPPDWGA